MNLRTKIICLFLFLLSIASAFAQSTKVDSLIDRLNMVILNKASYVQAKIGRIKKLQDQLITAPSSNLELRFNLYNKLFHEYKVFIYDSAFKYSVKLSETAYQLNDRARIDYAKVKLCFILISSGMNKEAFDSIKTINSRRLLDSTRLDYYSLIGRANFDLGTYDGDTYYNQIYLKRGLIYLDSALKLCVPGGYQYYYITNYKYLITGDINKALPQVNYLLKNLPLTSHQRAINNHHLGNMYLQIGDTDKALNAFLLASIFDIQAAVKENAALNSVADILYKKGKVKMAYALIEEAMKDALYYGAHQRKIEISSILPIIAEEELRTVDNERSAWLIYATALTALGILLLVFVFIIVGQVKKLRAAELVITKANHSLQEINNQLREADKIKEEYIGYYFNINSNYIGKIETVVNAIDQKLTLKKYDDIRYIVSNINLKREREELFVNFDKVFLKLFPDFVTIFNSYFKEEDRSVLKDEQLLNTELRIFALIRMGIHDTEKIANILNYSVNTIYTYKTKVKSKSLLPNDEFEKKIMEIQTV
jgi:tetratricopeptide (TPR) repeat protein